MRNRPIECKTIAKAISQTYEPYGVQCKPVTVLFLDMPDAEFDVNVHPAKREVRFANQSLVFLVVTHAIREALKQEFEKNSPFIDLSTASQDTEWKLPPPPMAMQAGDRLKPEEMASLVGQLMTTETPLKSPYGNPTRGTSLHHPRNIIPGSSRRYSRLQTPTSPVKTPKVF